MKIEDFNPNIEEIAERVLLGPQAEIIQKIDNFNYRWNTSIKSTKTFRWSPGVSEQLKKIYQSRILDWDKKYSGIEHFFKRIDNRRYYHQSMKNTLTELNRIMSGLRRDGITFQNNSDVVVETFNNCKNKIQEELEAIKEMYSEQDLQLDLQVYEEDAGGYYYEYKIVLPNPVMSIDSLGNDGGIDHLMNIKLYPIELRGRIDFIEHLNRSASGNNRNSANCSLAGRTLGPSDTVYHPYIYSQRHTATWSQVCLGDLQGDISKALSNFNIIAAAMLLTQWTSQYTVNRTHPHNKPTLCYYGLPKYIKDQENSVAYLAAFPHNPNTCGVPAAIHKLASDTDKEMSILMDNTCNTIDCQLKDKCEYWNNVVNVTQERLDNLIHYTDVDPEFVYSKLFQYRSLSNTEVIKDIEYVLNAGYNEDEELENEMEAHRAIEEENMTDEERIIAWYQRQITERSR